jgi:DNA-binding CsgD family transcriptional regulator
MFARHTADLGHLLECLSPHINRAFSISRLLGHGQALRSTLDMLMDALDRPSLVIGSDLRVRHANGRAEALFSDGTLGLDPFRRLTCGHRLSETKALHDAIHAALTEESDERAAPTPVRISQPDAATGEHAPLLAWAMPCGHEPGDPLDAMTGPAATSLRRQVLVILATPSSNTQIPAQALSILYGLTPAEARLAGAIAGGASVKDYADEHGNTEGTVRAQLKSVFAKTNTHRQAELAALLASISPPAPSRT